MISQASNMATWTVNSDISLQSFIGDIREAYNKHKFLKVKSTEGKQRSLDQNGISHVWYEQLARELKEDDALGHKNYCKLHHGIPILRAEDAEFREFYDATIKRLTYEQKLKAMIYTPVTSIMTKAQLTKYLDAVQADFADRVRLEFPA